jgi:hypothetical protein
MTSTHRDDSQMSRFERDGLDRFSARDAILAVLLIVVLLAIFGGDSVEDAANQTNPGFEQDLLAEVGKPTADVANALPFAELVDNTVGGLSPDEELGEGGFGTTVAGATPAGQVPPVTPDAFDPAELGLDPPPKLPLETVLVTGDSLSTPLDTEIATRLAGDAEVIREPHLAAAISRPELLDWGALSTSQVAKHDPDAVVMFSGANEFYAIPDATGKPVECCGTDWAALLSGRMREMMNTYRQDGDARVYWLTVPAVRDADRQEVTRVVNAAIEVAAQPWAGQVRVIDLNPIFTPDGEYSDSIDVDGEETIVRESDGIHLNPTGAGIAADAVIEAIDRDFASEP